MEKLDKISLPEALAKLRELETKYKSLEDAPIIDKDKMTALALSIGGFEALADSETGYLKYLEELSQKRYEHYVTGSESELNELEDKLAYFARMLEGNYSQSFIKVKRTQQLYAAIYVEVERYLRQNQDAKILHATDAVAKKLGENPKFVHTRYYEFRKKNKNMSLEEVVKRYQLLIPI